MRLSRVEIQSYRSIYGVSLEPPPFTVVVGPNNAGKSNLASALYFLAEVARSGLEVAVGREGGFPNLAFRRDKRTTRAVRFAFELELPASEIKRPFLLANSEYQDHTFRLKYEFSIRAPTQSLDADFRIASEDLDLRLPGRARFRCTRTGDSVSTRWTPGKADSSDTLLTPLGDNFLASYLERNTESDVLLIHRLVMNPLIEAVLDSLGSTRLLQLTPLECRKPGTPTPNPQISRHGDNLPAVVRFMQQRHKDAWNESFDAMAQIVPGLSDIKPEYTTDRHLTLRFEEDGGRRSWTPDEVSDGTVLSLALFTSLFDPRSPFLLIEEPENSVHPWIIKRFVDLCRHANKQVLITTHSPALVAYLAPPELAILWRSREGHTEVKSLTELDPKAQQLWEDGAINLYDLIDGGWIRETTPLGLQ
jgi:predicted ATPase